MAGKTCILALLFLLCCSCVFADGIVLNMEGYDALVSYEGEVISEPSQYSAIYEIGGGYFAFGTEEQAEDGFRNIYFALADTNGSVMTEAEYTYLEYDEGIVIFEKDGLYGAMNTAAEIVVPCEYTRLQKSENGFIALKSDIWDTTPDAVYIVAMDGSETKTGTTVLDMGNTFSEGVIAALSSETGTYGYLNANGEWEIEPFFSYAGEFADGMARASLNGGLGMINADGEWMLQPDFDVLEDTGHLLIGTRYLKGVTIFERESLTTLAEFSGKEVYARGLGEYAVIGMPEKTIVIDGRGNCVFNAPGGVKITYAGTCVIMEENGRYGLFASDGALLSELYSQIISAGAHSGGELFIAADYEYGADLTARYSLLDAAGNAILPCEYEMLYPLAKDRFFAQIGGKTGLIDASGAWIVCFGEDS